MREPWHEISKLGKLELIMLFILWIAHGVIRAVNPINFVELNMILAPSFLILLVSMVMLGVQEQDKFDSQQ